MYEAWSFFVVAKKEFSFRTNATNAREPVPIKSMNETLSHRALRWDFFEF